MVSGLLFKWEDSPALNHHCGFCERPLSHPGARASCFGTHAEPCHRYHQIMFMRLRGHTCNYCHTIEEAHHRRHKKIAEQIRDIYETCEVAEWTIVPSEPEERGRIRDLDVNLVERDETDRSLTPEDVTSSKRDRKDAKCRARAANRARVISQDDIVHIDAVIHSAEGLAGTASDGPCNTEELEEIERHLKFNAHVYNTQANRSALKKYARMPDVDVDFDTEIERILEAFRIDELLKRNTRNRGLQGKELKIFQSGVEDVKKALVEDLVLVKRDELETRMRRAGYLRYTNKAAHSIIEDRYTDKSWKTGEKYAITSSGSSGGESLADESSSLLSTPAGDSPPLRPAKLQQGPDRRHLEHIHKRVTGDDGLGQSTIEPYHAPLLSMQSDSSARQRAVQLRVVTKTASPVVASRAKKTSTPTVNDTFQTVLSGKKSKAPSVKPPWGLTASGTSVAIPPRPVNPWGLGATEIPDFRTSPAPAVQPVDSSNFPSLKGPDGFIDGDKPEFEDKLDIEPVVGHPVVSQKKAKKYEREARRKAKKTMLKAVNEEEPMPEPVSAIDKEPEIDADDEHDSYFAAAADSVTLETAAEVATPEVEAPPAKLPSAIIALPQPAPLPVTSHDKHTNWTIFKRDFIADQLTAPIVASNSDHMHPTLCVCETHDLLDCPFHHPYCVTCQDPLLDLVYLVYPCENVLQTGPYNRLHGQKLLAAYSQNEQLKGRIMLVDDDLLNYVMIDPRDRLRHSENSAVMRRLAAEYAANMKGTAPGPLMQQESLFDRLWNKNAIMKHEITQEMLMNMRETVVMSGTPLICYCQDVIPDDLCAKNLVVCARADCRFLFFHKACIKDMGVDKVSRWYCTECHGKMQLLAYKTLRNLGFDDIPSDDTVPDHNARMIALQDEYYCTEGVMEEMYAKLKNSPRGKEILKVLERKVAQAMAKKGKK